MMVWLQVKLISHCTLSMLNLEGVFCTACSTSAFSCLLAIASDQCKLVFYIWNNFWNIFGSGTHHWVVPGTSVAEWNRRWSVVYRELGKSIGIFWDCSRYVVIALPKDRVFLKQSFSNYTSVTEAEGLSVGRRRKSALKCFHLLH